MRICMLTSVHSPFDTRIFHKEAKSLAKLGYDVSIIAPEVGLRDTQVDGVNILSIPRYKSKFRRRSITLIHLLLKALEVKADIYHCHELDSLLTGAVLKIITGRKLVYDAHEANADWICSHFKNKNVLISKLLYPGLFACETICTRLSDVVITVNNSLKSRYLGMGGKRVLVVGNYPEPELFSQPLKTEVKGIAEQDVVIGRIGGMHLDTGILETIRAFKKLELRAGNVKLLLIGKILPSGFRRTIEKLIGEDENIILLDPIPYVMVPSYYQSIDISVVPSRPTKNNELGTSIKLWESMMCGIPVIACFGEERDIVEETGCGLTCRPLDIDDMSRKMEVLVRDEKLRADLGGKGRELAHTLYNWGKAEEKLIGVYEQLQG